MEVAVGPLVRGGQLGVAEQQQYRTLRAFKALLPLSPEEMVEKVLEGDGESNVPASLMLLHLYSGAPPELQSPHQVKFNEILYNNYLYNYYLLFNACKFVYDFL